MTLRVCVALLAISLKLSSPLFRCVKRPTNFFSLRASAPRKSGWRRRMRNTTADVLMATGVCDVLSSTMSSTISFSKSAYCGLKPACSDNFLPTLGFSFSAALSLSRLLYHLEKSWPSMFGIFPKFSLTKSLNCKRVSWASICSLLSRS